MCILNHVLFLKSNILAVRFVSETSVIFPCIRPLKCTSLKTVTSVAETCRRYIACITHLRAFVGSDIVLFVTEYFLIEYVCTDLLQPVLLRLLRAWVGNTARSLPAVTEHSFTLNHKSHTHTHFKQFTLRHFTTHEHNTCSVFRR
jgi:hypothetical protein